jgi:hypothetical protein
MKEAARPTLATAHEYDFIALFNGSQKVGLRKLP